MAGDSSRPKKYHELTPSERREYWAKKSKEKGDERKAAKASRRASDPLKRGTITNDAGTPQTPADGPKIQTAAERQEERDKIRALVRKYPDLYGGTSNFYNGTFDVNAEYERVFGSSTSRASGPVDEGSSRSRGRRFGLDGRSGSGDRSQGQKSGSGDRPDYGVHFDEHNNPIYNQDL